MFRRHLIHETARVGGPPRRTLCRTPAQRRVVRTIVATTDNGPAQIEPEMSSEQIESIVEEMRQRVLNTTIVQQPTECETVLQNNPTAPSESELDQSLEALELFNYYFENEVLDNVPTSDYMTSVFEIPIHETSGMRSNSFIPNLRRRSWQRDASTVDFPSERPRNVGLVPRQFMNPSSTFLDLQKKEELPTYDEAMERDDFQLPTYESYIKSLAS